jgi:hypothetical protein
VKHASCRRTLAPMKSVLRTLILVMPLLALALQGWAACPIHSVSPRSAAGAAHEHCVTIHVPSGTPHAPQTPHSACCDLTGCAGIALLPNELRINVVASKSPAIGSLLDWSLPSLFNGRPERPPKSASL